MTMRIGKGLSELEALKVEAGVIERIEAKEQQRTEALKRSKEYDDFPPKLRDYFLSMQTATRSRESGL